VFAFLAAALLIAAGCSSSSEHALPSTTTRPTVTAPQSTVARGPRGRLEFRAVQYDGVDPLQYPYPGQDVCKKLLAKSPPDTPSAEEVVLPDRQKQACYVLGPVLVTGAGVNSASVIHDPTADQWATDIHFVNNDFIVKVADPLINKEVAIVLNGVVQSAPVINPGITGHDVEIAGGFTKAQAVGAVASILGISPSSVRIDSSGG
jgi:preprotein translocase subunit SecD